MLPDDRQAVDAYYPAAGKGLLHGGEGRVVIGVMVGRHQNRTVYHQKIGVGRREANPVLVISGLRPWEWQQPVGKILAGPEGFQLSHHRPEGFIMLVVAVITGDMEDGVVRTEPSQGIDMGIGVIPSQIAFVQPEKTVGSEMSGQGGFDIVF